MTDTVLDRPQGRNVMHVLDKTGHTSTTWDSENEAEVKAARETFNAMTAKNYRAFKVRPNGLQGERMDTFDPKAEQMVLVPQLAGG